MKKVTNAFFTITMLMVLFVSDSSFAQMKMEAPKAGIKTGGYTLKTDMRNLWVDHVVWTRNVILCITDGLPGTDQAVKRLLQNQTDIGNAIKPYYGEEAGNALTALLVPHITIAAEVVKAAKKNDVVALEIANKRWYANADEISEFLSKANPVWKLEDLKKMMNEHLALTTDEAVQRIKKDYDADVVAYDKAQAEILIMADMLADGIIKQFPEKFSQMKMADKIGKQ
jgi:hypothetical protein